MENFWVTLLLGAFIGAIFGIPFGIFSNIITPYIQSWWKKRNLTIRDRKIDILVRNYKRVYSFQKYPIALNIYAFRNLFLILFLLSLQVFAGFVLSFGFLFRDSILIEGFLDIPDRVWFAVYFLIVFGFMSLIASMINVVINTLSSVYDFDSFKNETEKKLKKLGAIKEITLVINVPPEEEPNE